MEAAGTWALLLLVVLLLLPLALSAIRTRGRLPPGPAPLPLLGNLLQLRPGALYLELLRVRSGGVPWRGAGVPGQEREGTARRDTKVPGGEVLGCPREEASTRSPAEGPRVSGVRREQGSRTGVVWGEMGQSCGAGEGQGSGIR